MNEKPQDRRGELFYNMHHFIIARYAFSIIYFVEQKHPFAFDLYILCIETCHNISKYGRYDAERLCNGLARVKPFNFDDPVINEGYFGKMYSTNSGMNWGTRQEFTRIQVHCIISFASFKH